MGKKSRYAFYFWMLSMTVLIVWSLTSVRNLVGENRHRISDVQSSRTVSCERTYKSFPEMFRPFFPPNRKTWTKKQEHDWDKLQNRATALALSCDQQVQAK